MGAILRELRERQGWSLSYVAEICETSIANLSKIELGRAREYTLDLLVKVANAYGLRAYELMARVEAVNVLPETMSEKESALLLAYRSLGQGQQEMLMSVARTLRPPQRHGPSRQTQTLAMDD